VDNLDFAFTKPEIFEGGIHLAVEKAAELMAALKKSGEKIDSGSGILLTVICVDSSRETATPLYSTGILNILYYRLMALFGRRVVKKFSSPLPVNKDYIIEVLFTYKHTS